MGRIRTRLDRLERAASVSDDPAAPPVTGGLVMSAVLGDPAAVADLRDRMAATPRPPSWHKLRDLEAAERRTRRTPTRPTTTTGRT